VTARAWCSPTNCEPRIIRRSTGCSHWTLGDRTVPSGAKCRFPAASVHTLCQVHKRRRCHKGGWRALEFQRPVAISVQWCSNTFYSTPLALRMISNHRHGLALARLCTWKISTGTRLGMMVQTLPTRRPTSMSTIQTARQREEATLGSGKVFQRAGTQAGIGKLGTHSVRHSYRSWLDALGTAIAVQQKLMRHSFATR
jgi:hypothetical protein